jgi:hypothetical protein
VSKRKRERKREREREKERERDELTSFLPSLSLIGHEDSVGMSTFPLLYGVFTPKLLLPYRKVGQQQRALNGLL